MIEGMLADEILNREPDLCDLRITSSRNTIEPSTLQLSKPVSDESERRSDVDTGDLKSLPFDSESDVDSEL